MPLTQKVEFKTVLQRGNRIQVPKLIRWQFKLETDQVLKVGANALNLWTGWQSFYAKISKDGRILIPNLTLTLIQGEKPNIEGYILNITIEPV